MTQYRPEALHETLGADFFDEVRADQFPQHILRWRNQRWADRVGLGELTERQWIDHFGEFHPLPGSLQVPLALRYHGHQFQTYNPDLGDGRGFLFAQLRDEDGRLLDLGTKGSGRTPWSRFGDGRLTLKGGVRELLATEMLEALGVDTSKTFSLVETGEELERQDEPSPTRSSVLVRLSHSHIRIGTFQRLAAHQDEANLARLLDYAISTYMPELRSDTPSARATGFLAEVAARVARTGARWMAAGFVHGVLNTDNINITGESFDYGPWRFLPVYDPAFTAAYFDQGGLYAYGRQPDVLAWNLTRLAETLLPLADQPGLEQALNTFWGVFQREMSIAVLDRLALAPLDEETDGELVAALFGFLHESQAPFEQVFFDWRGGLLSAARATRSPIRSLYEEASFGPLRSALDGRAAVLPNLEHPYFARETPRTMLIDELEAIWAPIADRDDWSALERALAEINQMRQAYAGPDRPAEPDAQR